MHSLFSESWTTELARKLRSDENYHRAASRWEGDLVLALSHDDGDGPREATYLDLWHGECRAARVAGDTEVKAARFVIGGPATVWQQLFEGSLGPLAALAGRKLKLERGLSLQTHAPCQSCGSSRPGRPANPNSLSSTEWLSGRNKQAH